VTNSINLVQLMAKELSIQSIDKIKKIYFLKLRVDHRIQYSENYAAYKNYKLKLSFSKG